MRPAVSGPVDGEFSYRFADSSKAVKEAHSSRQNRQTTVDLLHISRRLENIAPTSVISTRRNATVVIELIRSPSVSDALGWIEGDVGGGCHGTSPPFVNMAVRYDMTEEDVDPTDPRPKGHSHVDRAAEWHYVDDALAETIALGPATNAEPGDDWILTFSAATATDDSSPAERVAVRLTPWALHELYIETKDLSTDARQAGHTAECGLCGEQVDLEKRGRTTGTNRRIRTVGPKPSVLRRGSTVDRAVSRSYSRDSDCSHTWSSSH